MTHPPSRRVVDARGSSADASLSRFSARVGGATAAREIGGMVWTSGTWRVKPGCEDEFVAAWREFATWSSAAFPGGAHAWLLRDREAAGTFVSVGPWPDDASVEAWRASDGFRERIGRIRALLDGFEPRTLDEVVAVG